MNKKKLITFGILGIFSMVLITATIVQYYGQVERDVIVNQAITFTGDSSSSAEVVGGEGVTSEDLNVESQTSVNVPLSIETTLDPNDAGIVNTVQFLLDNSEGTCLPYPQETCEKRIFIRAEDVGITTLNDLNTISWEAIVTGGYLPHIDVLIDTDGDGVKDDALVFEYAKVDTPCDNSPYPTGEINTFGDKGIVDGDALAWLSSGVAGYCGLPEFDDNHRTLTDWKSEGYDVIGFELEVDNWVSPSESEIRNILINGNSIEVTILPSGELDFNILTEFPLDAVGEYTIITEVSPR